MERPKSLFYFRQRSGQVDWRRLGVVDVPRIVRQGDISELQEVFDRIVFSDVNPRSFPLERPDLVARLVSLLQLSCEHLLNAADVAEERFVSVQKENKDISQHVHMLSTRTEELRQQTQAMAREKEHYKSALRIARLMLYHCGGDGPAFADQLASLVPGALQPMRMPPQTRDVEETVSVCPACGKAFRSHAHLVKHAFKHNDDAHMKIRAQLCGVQVETPPEKPEPKDNPELLRQLENLREELRERNRAERDLESRIYNMQSELQDLKNRQAPKEAEEPIQEKEKEKEEPQSTPKEEPAYGPKMPDLPPPSEVTSEAKEPKKSMFSGGGGFGAMLKRVGLAGADVPSEESELSTGQGELDISFELDEPVVEVPPAKGNIPSATLLLQEFERSLANKTRNIPPDMSRESTPSPRDSLLRHVKTYIESKSHGDDIAAANALGQEGRVGLVSPRAIEEKEEDGTGRGRWKATKQEKDSARKYTYSRNPAKMLISNKVSVDDEDERTWENVKPWWSVESESLEAEMDRLHEKLGGGI